MSEIKSGNGPSEQREGTELIAGTSPVVGHHDPEPTPALSAREADEADEATSLDAILDSFESAWRAGKQPRLEDYLPHDAERMRTEVLVELVHADLEYRYQAGEAVRVESYFERFPELNQAGAALTLIQSEYQLRRKRDTEVPADEYAERFPQFREELSERLLRRYDWPTDLPMPGSTASDAKPTSYPEVPGYEVLGLLGRGGMGVVYKARHLKLKRIVALKMILGGKYAGGEELERFLIEARAVARLHHPHIVQIYEIGDKDLPFFSLEYVEGSSLDRETRGVAQPARKAAELIETVARAIHVAHQQQIVHRDLKPANVLLTKDGQPKITDFGLAKQLDDSSVKTRSGIIMGTPSYMAPEQASLQSEQVGPGTDVYSLGAILYELLTGRPPFKGANEVDIIDQVRSQEPMPPSRLLATVPRDVETVCLKCLRKSPPQRYASAAELADDLRRFLDGKPIHARPVSSSERAWKWVRRRPTMAALIALAVLSAVLLAGLTIGSRYERQRVANVRGEAWQLLHEGEAAFLEEDWGAAQAKLESVVAIAAPELSLSVAELGRRAQGRLRELDKHRRFVKAREDALFQQALMSDRELPVNRNKACSAAREAIGLYGIDPESGTGPTLDAAYGPGTRAEIMADCYQLLLILALAEMQAPAGDNAEERRRRGEHALACLNVAATLGPSTRAYHLHRGRCLEMLGKQDDAAREVQQAARVQPSTPLDHFLLGEEAYRRGKFDQAIQEFNSVLLAPESQAGPSNRFWSQYYRSLCYLKQEKLSLAQAELNSCVYARPDFVWPYLLRAYVHGLNGYFAAAEADYRKVLSLEPDDDARYCVYVNRGEMSIRRGTIAEAIADLQRAVTLMPKQYQAYVNLSKAYRSRTDYAAAAAQLDKALALEPNSAAIYRERAQLKRDRADLAGALADFDRAIALDASPRDHFERGRLLYRGRQFDQALDACDAALKLNVDYAAAHRLKAECLFELKRFDEAEHSFDRAVDHGKPTAELLWERGRTRGILGNNAGALEDYTRALKQQPNDPEILRDRGWAYLAGDNARKGLDDFVELLRQKPADGDAYNGRGYALVKLGQYQKAVADARAARKHGPDAPRTVYNSARIYAQAVGKLALDPAQRNRLELRFEYQSQAMQLIRKALDLLPASQRAAFWQQHVQSDPAMNPVRRTDAFAQLEREMGGSKPAKNDDKP